MADVEDKATLMEVHLMKASFGKVDRSGDGKISRADLVSVMQELEQWSENDLNGIFDDLDKDKSGFVKFDEFIDYVMFPEGEEAAQVAVELISAADEAADHGEGEEIDNAQELGSWDDVDFDHKQRVNLKQFVMICRRLDEDDEEATEMYEKEVVRMRENGEGTAHGIPLHEFFHDLQIEEWDKEAMKHLKGIVEEVMAKHAKGEEDEAPVEQKAVNSALNVVVRELDQAKRPPEDAWAIFKEGKLQLSKPGWRAIMSFEQKQSELIEKVREFGICPPLLASSAGQAGNREHCERAIKKIIETCKAAGTKFTDPDWDVHKDEKAVLYVDKQRPGWDCTVAKPAGYQRLTDIIKASGGGGGGGMSMMAMLPSAKGPVLFKGGARPGDIQQGQIGTCFLLGALGAVVSNNEKTPHKIFIKYDTEIGVYGIRFNVDGEWTYVIVDDWMPVDEYGELIFAHSKDRQEVWVPLLEKAFCKLHTCYEMCDGGRAGEAIFSIVGGASNRLMIKKKHLENPKLYFKTLTQALDRGWILTTAFAPHPGAKGSGHGKCGEALLPGGLVGGHVYSVLKVVEAQDHKLVCCRNPWGTGEWKGKWSDANAEGEWTQEMKKATGYQKLNDGKFWMSIEDFVASSTGAEYSRVFGPQWKKVTQFKHFVKGAMKASAQWAYKAGADDELGFSAGDTIDVVNIAHGWWFGKIGDGKPGFFPGNYVKLADRPVASYSLQGTPAQNYDGPMSAMVMLMQPNAEMARKFAKRKEDGKNYKDNSYPLVQLFVVGPDGSVALKREGRQRCLSGELTLPGGGDWKIYALSVDGLGGDFVLRTYVKGGTATLKEVPGATIDDISKLIG